MRAFVIVVTSPILNHDLSFFQSVEDFSIEAFVTSGIEALDVAILPGTARLNVSRLAPTTVIQALTASAMNSGPLSERMNGGRTIPLIVAAAIGDVGREWADTTITSHSLLIRKQPAAKTQTSLMLRILDRKDLNS